MIVYYIPNRSYLLLDISRGNIFTNEQFISLLLIISQKLNLRTLGIFDVPQTYYALYG